MLIKLTLLRSYTAGSLPVDAFDIRYTKYGTETVKASSHVIPDL